MIQNYLQQGFTHNEAIQLLREEEAEQQLAESNCEDI